MQFGFFTVTADITKRLNRFLTFTPFVYEVVCSYELVFIIPYSMEYVKDFLTTQFN